MDIKKHLNVLNKKEQSAILKLVKKRLTRIAGSPGLQTYHNLHLYEELKPLIKKLKEYISRDFIITKCHGVRTDGEEGLWHHHKTTGLNEDEKKLIHTKFPKLELKFVDRVIVYYLKNKESLGTMFRDKDGKVVHTKGPENSLLIFKHESHRPPLSKRRGPQTQRYSISLDLSFKT